MGFLPFDDWISLRETKNDKNRCVLLNLSILKEPEEAAVHSQEVGGRNLHGPSGRGQAANERSNLRVIGLRKQNS